MNRVALTGLTCVLAAVAVVAGACGDDGLTDAPLPPMYTTTTTTTSLTTTTLEPLRQYEVQSGDLLGNIARQYGVDMQELMTLNGIDDPDMIQAGQVLKIPPSTSPVDITLPPP